MDAGPARQVLDAAICDALGLDGERVETIRRNLAAEPCGHRQALRRIAPGVICSISHKTLTLAKKGPEGL